MSAKKNKNKSKRKHKKKRLWWIKVKAKWKWAFLILLLIVLVRAIIVFPQHQAHSTFFEYLNIFFSWPFVILILGLILLFKFEGPISERIRTSPIKTPNFEIGVQPQWETKQLEEKELEEIRGNLVQKKEVIDAVHKLVVFERMLRYMYRSQFHLLKLLIKYEKGLPKPLIKSTFYKGLYLQSGGNPIYSFDAYLGWLRYFGKLITEKKINGEIHIKLTRDGESFVNYVNRMNYGLHELLAGP